MPRITRWNTVAAVAPKREGRVAGAWPNARPSERVAPSGASGATAEAAAGQRLERSFVTASAMVAAGLIGLALWSAYSVYALGQNESFAEDGVIETAQAALVSASGLLFLFAALGAGRGRTWTLLGCAALCGAFALRETELRLDLSLIFGFLPADDYRKLIIAAAFGLLFLYGVARFRSCKQQAMAFLRTRGGRLLMIGGGLLVLGGLFEQMRSVALHEYFEELSELFGYGGILVAAMAAAVLVVRVRRVG